MTGPASPGRFFVQSIPFMKIGIQTWGSEGDVRPLLALAAGLRAAGHDASLVVTHIANKDYTAAGAAVGVPVRHAGRLDPVRLQQAGEALVRETNILKQVRIILRDLFEPAAQDMLTEAKRLCHENDLVIGHFLVHPLRTAAEGSGRPHVPVFLAPLLPSAHVPPPGVPDLGRALNSFFWRLGGVVMDRMLLPPVNAMRSAEGLSPCGSATQDAFLSPRLNLVASSPSLFPRPADWAESIHLCGAFHLPERGGQPQLSEPLERFLSEGPPPVFLTIGSMSVGDPAFGETVRLFREAARLAGCRAIIQAEGASPGQADADVLYLQGIEHHLLFPRCAAVVHHGGAGTSHAASRAGVPSIVVEHATDQAFWGGVLHRAGIAPPMLHRRTVTALKLARAIRTTLGSPSMRDNARAVGEQMRQENGVARAVELIEQQRWN